jgi:methyl-accepting chemotaxis protein
MWRNLKIGLKLTLGFGLLMVIFIAAVAVGAIYVSDVEESSNYLSDEIVPSMILSTELERAAYELFAAAAVMQYEETEESVKTVEARRGDVEQILARIRDLNEKDPALEAPKYVIEKFAPSYSQYVKVIESLTETLGHMNAEEAKMAELGGVLTEQGRNLKDEIFADLKSGVGIVPDDTLSQRAFRLGLATQINEAAETARSGVQAAVLTGDMSVAEGVLGELDQIKKNADYLSSFAETEDRKVMAAKIAAASESYKEDLLEFIDTYREYEAEIQAAAPIMQDLNEEGTAATSFSQQVVKTVSEENVAELGSAVSFQIWATAAAVLLGFVVAFAISRSITKPLSTILGLAKRAESGDLTIGREDFKYRGRDELGVLADALAEMVAAQEASMREIVSVAHSLMGGASNLSAISEETNASMEEVKTSIDQVASLGEANGGTLEECSAGVGKMSAGADTVAQSSADGANFISHTAAASQKATETVNGVIAGMREVAKNARDSESKTRQVVSSVENVSSFVSVITGIADQTNLLALNAAIEAARAGEVGRGFAVVADEVRKLAEDSAKAARNVNDVIAELQSGARSSIEAATEAGRMLIETIENANRAQEDLNSAMEDILKVSDSVHNIASVAQEQAASSKEAASAIERAAASTRGMVRALDNIRHASDETARTSEIVAEQSEEMAAHASRLTETLSGFKLREEPRATLALEA